MSTAKPHQSSAQPDASDDLIAELARMMAQEAQGDRPERAAPVTPPVVKSSPPVPTENAQPKAEIPVQPVSAPRIPGQPASKEPSANGARFDFGRPPAATPIRAPEPLANWQDRLSARREPQAHPTVERQEPKPAAPEPRQQISSPEPRPAPSPAPALTALAQGAPTAPLSAPAGRDIDLDFDFGLGASGNSRQQAPADPVARTVPPQSAAPVAALRLEPKAAASVDAIADLIAADLQLNAEPVSLAPAASAPMPAQDIRPEPAQPLPVVSEPAPAVVHAQVQGAGDQFAVAPVFGVGTPAASLAPSAPVEAPRVEPSVAFDMPAPQGRKAPAVQDYSDPFAEIEMLVGEKVRNDRQAAPQQIAPKPANPFKSVATPVPLQKPAERPTKSEAAHQSAEDAILAAAAVSGTDVSQVDVDLDDEEEARPAGRKGKPAKEPRPARNLKPVMAPLVAATLLIAAGAGVYWGLGMGQSTGVAPVLTADTAPVKQVPAQPAPEAETESNSVVMNEIDGVPAEQEAEQLVSRDQTEGAAIADVTPVVTPQASETGLVNRKVRTVTVRPDGTIISGGEGSLAGAAALPVARPNVPDLPSTGVDASDLLAGATQEPATAESPINALIEPQTAPAAELVPPPAEATQVAPIVPAPEATALPAEIPETTAVPSDPLAPIPMPRPANRGGAVSLPAAPATMVTGALGTSTQMQALAIPPVAEPQPSVAEAAPAPSAAAYVQLSSQRTAADAQASLNTIQNRWGNLFGGVPLEVHQIDLADRGVFHRVLLPTSSLQEANQICADVKAQGGDCFALN